jgi:1-acyl-sn-glycerol-3-phosphate acyltransferase
MTNIFSLIRSSIFWLAFASNTIILGMLSPIVLAFPQHTQHHFARFYSQLNTKLLSLICGVNYVVTGRENIPATDQTYIIMANHQSTWETLAFASIFGRITWVLKRELLRIPFFGWGLMTTNPIAIDRKAGRSAIEQVKRQGKERLDKGINIVIFPEGTRVAAGSVGNYKKGGMMLAKYANVDVLPVAHNAGDCWPRHSFVKTPGTIYVHIGKLIETSDLNEEELLTSVKSWITHEQDKIKQQIAKK